MLIQCGDINVGILFSIEREAPVDVQGEEQ